MYNAGKISGNFSYDAITCRSSAGNGYNSYVKWNSYDYITFFINKYNTKRIDTEVLSCFRIPEISNLANFPFSSSNGIRCHFYGEMEDCLL